MLASSLPPGRGLAEVRRVAVLARGDALAKALGTALHSWGVEVVQLEGEALEDAVHTQAADALVQLTEQGTELVLELRVSSPASVQRWQLPGGPLGDPETAAALALSIKARLRNTRVAPEAQRAPSALPVDDASGPDPDAPVQPVVPPAASPPERASVAVAPSLSSARRASLVRIELGAGVRSGLVRAAHALGHFEGSVSLMHAVGRRSQLGLRLEAAGPTRTGLQTADSTASLRERALYAGLRGIVTLSSRLSLDLDARVGLSMTRLGGSRTITDERFDTKRQSLLLGASAGLGVRLGAGWYIVPHVAIDGRLRSQRYFIGTAPTWELRSFAVTGALRVGVEFL